MNIAALLRYTPNADEAPFFDKQYYILNDYRKMEEKLGIRFAFITNENDYERICEKCDGLIVPGSAMNINPKYYGGEDIPPMIDEYYLDALLIKYFYEHGKPIFGVCGGHQELNIYFGGSIRLIKDPIAHRNDTEFRHVVDIKKDSFVWDVFKGEKADTNCYHAWELDRIAPCFDVVATTPDGVAEAIEWREKGIFATQWHPEKSFHSEIEEREIEQQFFVNFIELCRKVKEERK